MSTDPIMNTSGPRVTLMFFFMSLAMYLYNALLENFSLCNDIGALNSIARLHRRIFPHIFTTTLRSMYYVHNR